MRYWIIAIIITLCAAVYQHMTGPTYSVKGKVLIADTEYSYKLKRSATNNRDCPVKIKIPDQTVTGTLLYRRFKTDDQWAQLPMKREGDYLVGYLPRQPAAGKLEYNVALRRDYQRISIPEKTSIVLRFKDPVPAWVLIPHIFCMFFGMLVSNRAGIECLRKTSRPIPYAWWAFGFLFAGGMLLGPVVQWYAFGELWTGFPFGMDLTDNKTLIAVVFWAAALILGRNEKRAKIGIFIAALVTLIIFSIPHSMFGSELNYNTGKIIQS